MLSSIDRREYVLQDVVKEGIACRIKSSDLSYLISRGFITFVGYKRRITMELTLDTDLADWEATLKGESQPFERLFRKYYNPLCDYCQGIVAEREVGEDVVQDVFVYMWNNRGTIHVKVSVKAYLYSSVRHGALAYLKKQALERAHSSRLTEFITYLQETEYSEEELLNLKESQKILQELPEQCRVVFLMNCIEGKKYKEIASELNISVNTVKTHLSKAYRVFRERLQSKDALFLIVMAIQKNDTCCEKKHF